MTTTMTKTPLGGWRLESEDAAVELTAEAARDFARRVLGLPRIERYGPTPA